MKSINPIQIRGWLWLVGFTLAFACQAEQFVLLTAKIQTDSWKWRLNSDGSKSRYLREEEPGVFSTSYTVRCVVGKSIWMMESDGFVQNARLTIWFTGTNLIEQFLVAKPTPGEFAKKTAKLLAGKPPEIGERFTKIQPSTDGNPGRPMRVADLMHFREQVAWLAFCSGPSLQRPGRQIYPPSDMWKNTGPWEFSDMTEVFDDALGLPQSIKLRTKKDQTVFQYQVHQSTNVLGWNIPVQFYLVQYEPAQTNGWQVRTAARGKLTSIKEGSAPVIPASVLKSAGK